MKAKQYCEKYQIPCDNNDKLSDCLVEIAVEMVREINTLTKARHAKCDDAIIAIVRELDNKFQAVLRICKVEHESLNAFRMLVEKEWPKEAEIIYR